MIHFRTTFFFAAFLLLVACGSKVAGLYNDPSFTPETLGEGKLAVLGLVFVQSLEEDTDAMRYVEQLSLEIDSRREDLSLVPPGEAFVAAGPDDAAEVLEQYRKSGRLTAEQIARLSRARTKARYLLLGRVDTDYVERTSESTRTEDDGRLKLDIEMISRREMGATFDIFDLQTQDLVWTAYFQRVEAERGERMTYEEDIAEIEAYEADAQFAVNQMIDSARHPEPPPRSQLLRSFARDVARHLPGGR